MPFTISHVAAVLPFSRFLARRRLLSATIIGSMVPDFGFLMPWRPARIETHSAIALLTFCLPVGIATFWIFQQLVKPALTEILPDAAYSRWRRFMVPANVGSLAQWILAACGVVGGAVTHLVWDAFTHEGARGVRMIPALDDPSVEIAGHHLVGARLLQDVSSLVGLAIVLAVVIYGLRGARSGAAMPMRRLVAAERCLWVLAYATTTAMLTGLFLTIKLPTYAAGHSLSLWITNCSIAALRGFATASVVVSLGLHLRLRADP